MKGSLAGRLALVGLVALSAIVFAAPAGARVIERGFYTDEPYSFSYDDWIPGGR